MMKMKDELLQYREFREVYKLLLNEFDIAQSEVNNNEEAINVAEKDIDGFK